MSCGFHSIGDEDCSLLGYESLSIGNMLLMVCRRLLPPAYGGQRSVRRWENYVGREPVGGEALQDGWSHMLSLQYVRKAEYGSGRKEQC
jgi:hypothetical protein